MPPIRVAFCTDGIYPLSVGGMQKHSRLLIEELSTSSELDLTVIHPHTDKLFEGPVREILIEGIDETKNYLLECYRYSKRVYKQLVELKPDVVYSQGLSVWYGAGEFRKQLIINPHGLEPYQVIGTKLMLETLPVKLVFNYLFKQAAVLISLGGKLTKILESKRGKAGRVAEIPNGAHLPKNPTVEKRNENSTIRCLFLGRFASNKGINVLFESLSELDREKRIDLFEFTLAGKGPLFEFYNRQNKYDNVKLIGFVPDDQIQQLYETHDALILPTLFEGMPTVVLEAMSFGLPVIVSDVGATSVMVDDGNGRLIQPGSVKDLKDAFIWLSGLNSNELKSLGMNSREKFLRNFTWQSVAKKHVELFEELVHAKPKQ